MVELYSHTYNTVRLKYVKTYAGTGEKLLGLNYCEHYLMMYLAEKADDECVISTSKQMRTSFINYIRQVSEGKKVYKDETVWKALQELKRRELLIGTGNRGFAYVNPRFHYRGRSKKRLAMIEYIERKTDEMKQIKNYINGTE